MSHTTQPIGVSVNKCLQDQTTKQHRWSDPQNLMSCTMSINVLVGGLDAKHQAQCSIMQPDFHARC